MARFRLRRRLLQCQRRYDLCIHSLPWETLASFFISFLDKLCMIFFLFSLSLLLVFYIFIVFNVEFTPSQGSTPIHQSSAPLTPRPVNSIYIDRSPETSSEPSPTGRKKLRELFRETLLVEQEGSEPNAAEVEANKRINLHTTNTDPPPRQLNGTPYRFRAISFCSSTVTSSGDPKNRKERLCKSQHCCLPSLQSFGLDDRKQKMTTKHCTAWKILSITCSCNLSNPNLYLQRAIKTEALQETMVVVSVWYMCSKHANIE